MIDSLDDIKRELTRFAEDRDWNQFHTPRNLVLALMGEVGELAEQVQWKTDEEVQQLADSDPKALGDELADILIYLVRLADVLEIDLGEAAELKLGENEKRYSTDRYRGSAEKAPHE